MNTQQLTEILLTGGVVGVLLDPMVTFIKSFLKLDEHPKAKFVVSLTVSILAGVLVVGITGMPVDTLTNILVASGTVFSAATITYNLYWKGSTGEKLVEKVAK